ncbi:FecR domain-containing protein [Mucilaginibacter sp. PAMB04274]|uniref:FecR family protein n=1 Tax=Mucilaginibacter sp. PAMB04274 TaxID=3138568 RepID=UPI0031F6CCFF
MTDKTIANLLEQFADNTISREDFQILIHHFKLSGNDEEIWSAMEKIWQDLKTDEFAYPDEAKNAFYQRLVANKKFRQSSKLRSITPWYRYAAAAVLVLIGATGLYLLKHASENSVAKRYKNDIKPGYTQATLTLANGQIIDLSRTNDKAVAQEQGVIIKKTADGALLYDFQSRGSAVGTDTAVNILKTPKGGQFQVTLSDGSHVWLNTASALTFPVRFKGNERTVKLTGEAYFEVAKNEKSPFRVITANQQIKVLGTHFDVNAYDDEPVSSTTLLEGRVNIITPAHSIIIKPGQQAVLTNNHIDVQPADLEEAMAWKNGLFLYNQQSLETIMRQVSRWYNVEVVFEDKELKKQLFSGALSRFKNISELLEVLETTGSVHFKIEGRRVTAMQ